MGSEMCIRDRYDKFISIVQYGLRVAWDQRALTDTGPFLMADPGIHFILLRANRDLLKVAKLLKLDAQTAELEQLVAHGMDTSDYFWNDAIGAFTARNVRTGEFSNGFSSASALCFYAGAGSEYQRNKTIDNITRVAGRVKYLMPSWDPDAVQYDPQRYWCGPVWPQMNYIISTGLQEQGYSTLADSIRQDMARLLKNQVSTSVLIPRPVQAVLASTSPGQLLSGWYGLRPAVKRWLHRNPSWVRSDLKK